MVYGIIMLKTVPGHERRVHSTLRGLSGIRTIYILFGDFDLLLDVQVEGLLALNGLVERIREMEGVVTTRTILAHAFERCGPPGTVPAESGFTDLTSSEGKLPAKTRRDREEVQILGDRSSPISGDEIQKRPLIRVGLAQGVNAEGRREGVRLVSHRLCRRNDPIVGDRPDHAILRNSLGLDIQWHPRWRRSSPRPRRCRIDTNRLRGCRDRSLP